MSIICPLFSGSTGNSTYIATEKSRILIDAGVSAKSIIEQLSLRGADVSSINAIAITHEHSDHIKGLKPLLKKSGAMLIASEKTLEKLAQLDIIPANCKTVVLDKGCFEIGDIAISRFATSHDCEGSSGYTLSLPKDKKFSLCTDLGIITDEVSRELKDSDLVLLESNHDVEMLKKGPYPPYLKVRIMGDKGHISNNVCASELKKLLKCGTEQFILGHLSQNNNTPILARATAEASLMDLGAENNKDYILKVASPVGNGVSVL